MSSWVIVPAQASLEMALTVASIEKYAKKASILELLNSADLGIADVAVERIKAKRATFSLDAATGKANASDIIETELRLPRLKHQGEGGVSAFFDFRDESQGTQRMFALAGIIIHILEQGSTLVVDELENSMHPLAEKGPDLGSTLVPLSEFSARKTEAFEKGYLEGRYGVLPILRSFHRISHLWGTVTTVPPNYHQKRIPIPNSASR